MVKSIENYSQNEFDFPLDEDILLSVATSVGKPLTSDE